MSLTFDDPTATRKTTRKLTITKSAIDALKPGDVLRDDRVPGLQVRARAGAKSFHVYYRTRGGDERRPKIGDAKVLSITDAREISKVMLTRVAAGEDPSAQRDADRTAATMDDLWTRCAIEIYHSPKTKPWHSYAKGLYDNHIKPLMGKRKVKSIDEDDVQAMMDAMRETPIAANRTKAVLSKMLKAAARWKMRPKGPTPCNEVEGYKERKRRRYARPHELAAIGAAIRKRLHLPELQNSIAYIFVMAFSGARPSEIGRASPDMVEQVEGGGGVLRIPEGKNGEYRDVYLPPQAMAVLAMLPKDRKNLVGRSSIPRELWHEIRTEAGCPDLWFRDFRRTFSSVGMSKAGLSKDVIGGLLAHKSEQTTAVYARLMEDDAHGAAAATANAMEGLLSAAA